MSDVVSPTQEQFQETARNAFNFLQREYGFQEIPTEYNDPFGLQYQNNHCRVQVTGRSFGFGLDVGVTRLDYNAKVDPFEGVFPLWCVLKLRAPKLYVIKVSGQAKELKLNGMISKVDMIMAQYSRF
jgi:hypothetical protein